MQCPLCHAPARTHATVDSVEFFDCTSCDFIFANPEFLALVDQGSAPRKYDQNYWKAEDNGARFRSWGSSLARFAEGVIYSRIPINRTIDIGTGPGYLLESLQYHLPHSCHKFFGVEKFPGEVTALPRLRHKENYVVGYLGDIDLKFEFGTCIEVIEHLTPNMVSSLAKQLAQVSVPGSLFIFNTALTDHVRNHNPGYIDPKRRGHITVWSVKAATKVFEPHGLKVWPIDGKKWAFAVECDSNGPPLRERVWSCLPENQALLSDPVSGSSMFILGRESARVSALEAQVEWMRKR